MGQSTTPPLKQRPTSSLSKFGIGPERDQFLENFALLISSGTGVLVALESLGKDSRSPVMRKIIEQMRVDIDAGHSLSTALEASGILSPQVISLIRIGEESGRLPENLKVVAVQQQKERLFQSKLVSAMIYPILVFTVTVLVGLMIAWFVLPKLSLVFGQLRIQLPLITKLLIGLGEFLNHYGFIAVPAAAGLLLLSIYLVFFAKPTKGIGEWFILAIPGLRRIVVEVELSRFSYIMGSLLNAGLPVLETLASIENATPFIAYRRLYHHLRVSIEEGNSFKNSIETFPRVGRLIPIPIQQLINASEQSGTLAESFLRINALYEEKSDITTKNLVVIIEPALLVVVWFGVMFVAIGVILPIYKLVGQFSTTLDQSSNPTLPPAEPAATPAPATSSILPSPSSDAIAQTASPTVLGAHDQADQTPLSVKYLTVKNDGFESLNVRDRPSESGIILGQVHPLDTFAVSDTATGWFQIQLSTGEAGWVSGQFVTVVQP